MWPRGRDQHLCEQCRSIFEYFSSENERHRSENEWDSNEDELDSISCAWKSNLQAVEASAGLGCRLCTDLLEELRSRTLDFETLSTQQEDYSFECTFSNVGYYRSWQEGPRSEDDNACITFLATSKQKEWEDIEFGCHYLQPVDNQSNVDTLPVKANPDDVGMYARLRKAKQWLRICVDLQLHPSCSSNWNDMYRIPTRLIELRQEPLCIKARLVDGAEMSKVPQYITLSYRWGSEPTLRLQRATLPELKRNIPLAQLRQLFRDIFSIVLALGCNYVWIDALCIIQDSTRDWTLEAERMAAVYHSAYCNIAVTTPNGERPMIIDRLMSESPSLLKIHATVRARDSEPTGVFELIPNDFWRTRIDRSVLSRRAWVLQERFFSPRILYLTRDQILWECQELKASDTFPIGIPEVCDYLPLFHYRQINDPYRGKNDYHYKQAWETLRWAYSGSALTYPTDKLFAIAGIVKGFEGPLEDRNIAGLWRKSFLTDLLWARAGDERPPRRGDGRAPSWSWACLDVRTSYPFSQAFSFEITASIQSIDITSQYLAVSGRVKLRAPLTKGTPIASEETTTDEEDGLPPKGKGHRFQNRAMIFDADNKDLEGLEGNIEGSQQDVETQPIQLYMLTITKAPALRGLLLRKTNERGHYSRIGYFHLYPLDGFEVPAPIEMLVNRVELLEADYLEDHGEGVYTVVLV